MTKELKPKLLPSTNNHTPNTIPHKDTPGTWTNKDETIFAGIDGYLGCDVEDVEGGVLQERGSCETYGGGAVLDYQKACCSTHNTILNIKPPSLRYRPRTFHLCPIHNF